jgi:transcriptional regulator with XRE-family HTH domain
MTVPNTTLRAARVSRRMSQDDLARAIRDAGRRIGEPNACSKRYVQRLESGVVTSPRGPYLRALEYAMGEPARNLGFADERYGLDREAAMALPQAGREPRTAQGPLTGIWLSRYEYESSGRGETYADLHHVLLNQGGAQLTVRSLPRSAPSSLVMDLTQNGAVLTGTWSERTDPQGYYQGAVYHGAIQLLLEPSGRRMVGKWVGFGRDWDVNTGPWTLELVTSNTGPEAMQAYDRPPAEGAKPEDAEVERGRTEPETYAE